MVVVGVRWRCRQPESARGAAEARGRQGSPSLRGRACVPQSARSKGSSVLRADAGARWQPCAQWRRIGDEGQERNKVALENLRETGCLFESEPGASHRHGNARSKRGNRLMTQRQQTEGKRAIEAGANVVQLGLKLAGGRLRGGRKVGWAARFG